MNIPIFHRSRRRRAAFTLVEMLLVLGIIALLMGMAIYNLIGVDETAKDKRAMTDILGYKEALATYQLQTGTLPTTDQGLKSLWVRPTAEPVPARWRAMMSEETLDPWNHSYQYLYPGKRNTSGYDLFSLGADGQPGTADDIGNWPASANAH